MVHRTAQKWPVAVAPNLGFTSKRSHPVPSLQWGAEIQLNHDVLAFFAHPGAMSPMGAISPVSYTHLTLPTIYSV